MRFDIGALGLTATAITFLKHFKPTYEIFKPGLGARLVGPALLAVVAQNVFSQLAPSHKIHPVLCLASRIATGLTFTWFFNKDLLAKASDEKIRSSICVTGLIAGVAVPLFSLLQHNLDKIGFNIRA